MRYIPTMKKIIKISFDLLSSLCLLAVVFSFGAAGLIGGVSMLHQVRGWWQADELVAVQATIDQLSLDDSAGIVKKQRVMAEFFYQYNGKTYHSNRIHVAGDGASAGNEHHDTYKRLQQPFGQQQTVTLWLDPHHPEFAVYDKSLQWQLMLFLIPFVTLFPAISFGAMCALRDIWSTSHGNRLHSGSTLELSADDSELILKGVLSLLFSVITYPIAGLILLQERQAGNWKWLSLVLLAASFYMVWLAGKSAYTRWSLGKLRLKLSQPLLTGVVDLPARLCFETGLGLRLKNAASHYSVKLELLCIREYRDDDSNDSTSLYSRRLDEMHVVHGTQSLDFHLSLPLRIPVSGKNRDKNTEVIWKLQARILDADISFELPVRKGMGKVISAHDLSNLSPQGIYTFPVSGGNANKQSRLYLWLFAVGYPGIVCALAFF